MDKYANHLKEIEHKLTIIEDFISEEQCDDILRFVSDKSLNDRASFSPNYGLKHEVGKYKSIGITQKTYPDFFNKYFNDKLVNGFSPYEIQINKYEAGEYIPPHKDQGTSLYTVTVPLQTNKNNYLVFGDPNSFYNKISVVESDNKGMTKSFSDVKGRGYMFNGTNPIHWVPPTDSLRYSVIFLYSLPL